MGAGMEFAIQFTLFVTAITTVAGFAFAYISDLLFGVTKDTTMTRMHYVKCVGLGTGGAFMLASMGAMALHYFQGNLNF